MSLIKGFRTLLGFIVLTTVIFETLANYDKCAKIITEDGNLILEAGLNGNITIRLKGQSTFIINELDVLKAISTNKWSNASIVPTSHNGEAYNDVQSQVTNLKISIFGPNGLLSRIVQIENRTIRNVPNNMLRRMRQKITLLESRVQRIESKLMEDNCINAPCQNGGTCYDLYDQFACQCTKEWQGKTCTEDVNECFLFAGTDLGCQNGAICNNHNNGYSCICQPGWVGVHCKQRQTDCLRSSSLELCGHGTCINTNDATGYKCICDQGWKTNGLTPSCSSDVDECSENSTHCASHCINLPGSFVCAPCGVGFTGNGFSCKEIDECSINNGGCSMNPMVNCINTYGSFRCGECPNGWYGDGKTCTRSEEKSCSASNICHPKATCQIISNTEVCTCPRGMIGNGIGLSGCVADQNICSVNPCMNNGSCVLTLSGFRCICPQGYLSPLCTEPPNSCASNPCQNNGICRQLGVSYRCVCAAGYSGRNCRTQVNRCGGILVNQNGHLQYPPTQKTSYSHNVRCAWVIRTNVSQVLNVTFTSFDLEDAIDCRFDWLQIHDGGTSASQLLGRFCGNRLPKGGNIITTRNEIYLWFRSDSSFAKEGFELSWNSVSPICGGTFEINQQGTIKSPGSPGYYPPNRDCKWMLRAPNNQRVMLTFFSMQLENHNNCNHDFFAIYDGITTAGILLEKFCNSSHPAPFIVPSNEVLLHFHSDDDGTDTGFQLHYSIIASTPGCGGTFTAQSGDFRSPNLFDGEISCEYRIRLVKGVRIKLEFTQFKMGSDSCLKILDGEKDSENLVGRWCGDILPPNYVSYTNEILIKFHSNDGLAIFKLSYSKVCEFIFEEPSGVITSPNYPENYNDNLDCTYEIRADIGNTIALQFVDFELQSTLLTNTCSFDSLEIYDGFNTTVIGQYCGNQKPSDILTSTNLLTMRFHSDANLPNRGFNATYSFRGTTDCGGIIKNETYHIKPPMERSTTTSYKPDTHCVWTIVAPAGFGIELSWLSFDLEDGNNCMFDFIQIFENYNKTPSSSIGRFCGTDIPPTLLFHRNIITIEFESDVTDSGEGFEAAFKFVDVKKSCSGNYFSSYGTIFSPGWGTEHISTANCTWVISVPNNRQIELIIKSFQIEGGEGNFLEIRNGGSAVSPLIGIYSNESIPSRIPSLTNQMYINFVANTIDAAKHFEITWESTSTGCGGVLDSPKGSIASPGYPQPYPNKATCEWRIITSEGSAIQINLVDVKLERLMVCDYDQLDIYDGTQDTNTRIGRYCNKEDDDVIKIETTGNKALVRFVTDISISDRGFFLTYEVKCQNEFHNLFGIIESPNYPNPFPLAIQCQWNITAPKGNLISVHFVHFDLYDELESRSNETASLPQLIFMNVQNDTVLSIQNYTKYAPRAINSTTNKLFINFKSPTFTEGSLGLGFRLEYEIFGCVEKLLAPKGRLQSPQYPNMYPNDVECVWTIEVENGKGIELKILDLDLEDSTNCTNDGLKVWDGYNNETHTLGVYCGKKTNITLTSASHVLMIKMHTNSAIRKKGFVAEYQTIDSKCGGKYNAPNGFILSPNYPSNYDSNALCEWMIEVAEGHTIAVTFEEFDTENSYGCHSDKLILYDGFDDDTRSVILKHCGDGLPSPATLSTKSNNLMIVFESDFDTEMKGFKLSYNQNCGQRIIVNDTGRIHLESGLQDQTECIWILVADDPSRHITFTTSNVGLNPKQFVFGNQSVVDCHSGVTIYDGTSTVNIRPRTQFCDDHHPSIISYGSALTIKITLDMIKEFEGFYSVLDNACGGKLNSIRGKFATPLYPSSYPLNTECIWKIVATEGNSIEISIDAFDLELSEHCNEDYLEIRERDENGKLLSLLCGNEWPNIITGEGGLWIKFNSNDETVGKGFLANYDYSRYNELTESKGQIFSPNYPEIFISHDFKYSWRISTNRGFLIVLNIKYLSEEFSAFTTFYDGYDETALIIDLSNAKTIISNTNVIFITSIHGSFHFEWHTASKNALSSNLTEINKDNCFNNMLTLGLNNTNITSPGYPFGYGSNLNCSWILRPSNLGGHAVVKFKTVDLEPMHMCLADFVEVLKSSDLLTWIKTKTICKLSREDVTEYHGEPYLKLNFNSDYSNNGTGFEAMAYSVCGSTISGASGILNLSEFYRDSRSFRRPCVLKIKVGMGRKIRLRFESFEIGSSNGNLCRNYLLIKNGIDEDAPNLGQGKFCNKNEIKGLPETTSNFVYIKFVLATSFPIELVIAYEETDHGCSKRIQLTDNVNSTTITSPNYPNIPSAHIECVWTIMAPVNKILTINFLDRFSVECKTEYVQLNDGGTELSNKIGIGKFCASRPDTQFTTGNLLRIKYFTDSIEPGIGFKAEIAIGKCGGTYHSFKGTIISPILYQLNNNKNKIICDYRIIRPPGFVINVTLESVLLPESADCSVDDHLEIFSSYNGTETLKNETICRTIESPISIKIDMNEVLIRYIVFANHNNANQFIIKYSSKYQGCIFNMEADNGVGQSLGYPNAINTSYCSWNIAVAKGRRIRVDFLDIDTGRPNIIRFIILNNPMASNLYFVNYIDSKNFTQPIFSSDNKIRITTLMRQGSGHRGIKFNFTSVAGLYCVGDLNRNSGEVTYPNVSDIVCSYEGYVDDGNTVTITIKSTNTTNNNFAVWSLKQNKLVSNGVAIGSLYVLRLPFSFKLAVFALYKILVPFTMTWKRHTCGNTRKLSDQIPIVINQNLTNTSIDGDFDCAWQFTTDGVQVHIALNISTNFKLNCDDEFLEIRNGPLPNSPSLGRYCKETNLTNITAIDGVFIEYHTNKFSAETRFEISVQKRGNLGGELFYPFPDIEFREEYTNNVESVWTVHVDNGYHIGVRFEGRFYIEESVNCTKDYLKIQEKIEGEWADVKRLCGREKPAAYNSSGEEIRFIFRSDSDIVGDGFKIKLERLCGGVYYVNRDEVKQISSPNSKKYNNTFRCHYKLIAKNPGDIIVLNFINFDLGRYRMCFDNFTISSDVGSNKFHETFCSRNSPGEIRLSDEISMEFVRTEFVWTRPSFKFEYSIQSCGGVITTPGLIASPKQKKDNKYPLNLHCNWNITAPINHKILIKFELINFEYSMLCTYDYVEVFAGKLPRLEDRKMKLCGNMSGTIQPISISNQYALIHSACDNTDASEGFSAIITFPPECDKQITIPPSTSYHLNTFSGQYNNSLHCNYVFGTESGYQLQIKFNSFHIENCTKCSCDYVEFRDGAGPFANLIGRYCGHELPANMLTTKSKAFMVFMSDLNETSSGFDATISSVPSICGSQKFELKEDRNVTITSPTTSGGSTYSPNLNCYWYIKADRNIHLHFEKLELQDPNENGTCANDFLEIYNDKKHDNFEDILGSEVIINGKKVSQDMWSMFAYDHIARHIFCGNQLPADYYTNTENVYVRFLTDSSIEKSGFKLTASRVFGCFRNFTNSQGRIILDTTEDCDIYIIAPENYTLSLYYNNIYLPGFDCEGNLEIYDLKNSSLLKKSCGYLSASDNVYSNSNKLRIKSKLIGILTKIELTFLGSTNGVGCGGDLINYQGEFTSPFYPDITRNHSDCRWNIQVPNNKKVHISFLVFDLGSKVTCGSDYVQIIENEVVTRQFCGGDNPGWFIGQGNKLTVRFRKTVNFDGTGWHIEFRSAGDDKL